MATSDKLVYLGETKVAIKDAIEAKGITVPLETNFRDYAAKISEITASTPQDVTITSLTQDAGVASLSFQDGLVNKYVVKDGALVLETIDLKNRSYDIVTQGDHTIYVESYLNNSLVSSDSEIVNVPEAAPLDTDLQAVLDIADGQGYAKPEGIFLDALNDFFLELKAKTLYSKFDSLLNFAYNNVNLQLFSKICLKRKIIITTSGGLIYENQGFKGNSANGIINTLVNYATTNTSGNYKQNTGGRGALIYSSATSSTKTIDYQDSNFQNIMSSDSTVNQRINSGGLSVPVNLSGIGLMSLHRINSIDIRAYNKDTETIATSASLTPQNNTAVLLGGPEGYSNVGISGHYIGARLTAAEILDLRNAYNVYLNKIGLTQIA